MATTLIPKPSSAVSRPVSEIGRSGIRRFAGNVYEEFLFNLRGLQGIRVYREMRDNDAIIGATMFAIEQVIEKASWSIRPAGNSLLDKEAAAFLKSCMHDMTHTWQDFISEALTCLTYGWCLPGDQPILTDTGTPKCISDVSVGDLVLTNRGRARKVLRKAERVIDEDIVSISVRGYPHSIRVTKDHEVLTKNGFKRAELLTTDDVLLRPKLRFADGGDYDTGWLVGLYLAEGHLRQDVRQHSSSMCFSVHQDESAYVKAKLDAWASVYPDPSPHHLAHRDARITPDKRSRGTSVWFTNGILRALIETVVGGNDARTKHLKSIALYKETARGILDGWLYGDGCERIEDGRIVYRKGVTVSQKLAQQMQLISGSLGSPSHMAFRLGGETRIRGRSFMVSNAYLIGAEGPYTRARSTEQGDAKMRCAYRMREVFGPGLSNCQIAAALRVSPPTIGRWFKDPLIGQRTAGLQCNVGDEYIEHQVLAVTREHFVGPVYDIEVEEDHTFCAGPIVVSNCWFEVVYKLRKGDSNDPRTCSRENDGLIGWRKLARRVQSSFYSWNFNEDTGELESFSQIPPPDYKILTIPLSKSLHIRTKIDGENPEGHSILRNAYRSWYFLKNLEEIEAIGMERDLVGLPVFTPPEGFDVEAAQNADVKATITKLIKNMRRDEVDGVCLPSGFELNLLAMGGSRRQFDSDKIINRYRKSIAVTLLAQFIMLGMDRVGSFALGKNQNDLFLTAVQSLLSKLAAYLNRVAVPMLFAQNPHFLPLGSRLPRLTAGRVTDPNLNELSNFVMRLGNSGFMLPKARILSELEEIAGLSNQDIDKIGGIEEEEEGEQLVILPAIKKPKPKLKPRQQDQDQDQDF